MKTEQPIDDSDIELAKMLGGLFVSERTLRSRIRTYRFLMEKGYSHEKSLESAKQVLHVG